MILEKEVGFGRGHTNNKDGSHGIVVQLNKLTNFMYFVTALIVSNQRTQKDKIRKIKKEFASSTVQLPIY